MGRGWSVVAVREGFKGEWLVCCRHGRRFPLGMDGLLLMCETVSVGYRLSVVAVREDSHGVWLVCHRSARRFPWGVIGLSQKCEREFISFNTHCSNLREVA